MKLSIIFIISFLALPVNADEYRIVTGLKAPMSDYYEAIEKEMFKRIGHTITQNSSLLAEPFN